MRAPIPEKDYVAALLDRNELLAHYQRVTASNLALEAQVKTLSALSHEDACRLSQEFNRNAKGIPGTYRLVQETRINEWLKELIAAALAATEPKP